jgi:putative acetyltransferase
LKLRRASNSDCGQIIELISGVYREYGETICLEDADQDLLDLESNYFARDGYFWVLDNAGQIQGTHAAHASKYDSTICTFRRLYLARTLRGTEWGHRLMQITIDWARERDHFRAVEFWSDTRFHRAHQFFRKFGFRSTGEVRTMHDGHEPYHEFFFYLDLDQVSQTP